MPPLFTICIPTYNRASLIKRTLDSLVTQSYENFEVLVIDDGSTDNTAAVVEEYKESLQLIYIKKENGGKHTALNKGIEEAKGKYFLILDSDDYLENFALSFFEEVLSEYANEQIIGVMARSALESKKLIGNPFPKEGQVSSYIDFHFGSGYSLRGNRYKDCCEINETRILKQFRFPEDSKTKFVPESYLFDQVGVNHSFVCFNKVVRISEYQMDGITNNADSHREKNIVGFLYKSVNNIDVIFKETKIPLIPRLTTWMGYWQNVLIDKEGKGPRVQTKSLIGYSMKILTPLAIKISKAISK